MFVRPLLVLPSTTVIQHRTVLGLPQHTMQRIEITTKTHQPTGVSAPEHNSTIGPNLPFHLSPRALVPSQTQ
jgi:hypothetical protein